MEWVEEDLTGLLEAHAVFALVGAVLRFIPLKSYRDHSAMIIIKM